MNRLVALALPPGEAFVEALRRAWDDGDAVLPVDGRLPDVARRRLLDALAPAVVVEPGAVHRRGDGRPVEPGDALVMTTSGTTGDPKGVVLTHDAVAASAAITSRRLGVDPGADRWLACLPVAHIGGLSVITRALLTGTALTVHERFDPVAVTDAARDGATLVSMVPTMVSRIDPQPWRQILLGGAAIAADRPPNTVATYGMTETGSAVVYDHRPLDGVEVRVVDGQIHVRGPVLLRAYRDGTDPRLDGGWFATGDGGTFVDGRLEVHGRLGDMIVTGGENVWPDPVERILARHPAVGEVAVVGRPDPEWGQRVTAVVVPADGLAAPDLGELRDLVRAELPSFCAPHAVEVVDHLARTALGKVRRVAT